MITFSGNNSLRLCQYSVIYLKKSFLHRSKIPLKSVCSISYQMKYLNAIKSSENNLVFEGKTKYENTFGDIEKYELKYQRFKDDPEDLEEYSRQKAGQGKTVATYIKEISLALRNNDVSHMFLFIEFRYWFTVLFTTYFGNVIKITIKPMPETEVSFYEIKGTENKKYSI